MSSKQNDINLGNYEEFFILYMDGELSASQKLVVEEFISQHPHLAEELEVLFSTKLPLDEVPFSGKAELLSSNMKMNLVDERLLLYIDDELSASEKVSVEEKLKMDKDFSLQHSILLQTKLDVSEQVLHPNKKELYRHTERVIAFKVWMRVAAAVILLLLGSLFFLTNRSEKLPDTVVQQPASPKINSSEEKQSTPVEKLIKEQQPIQQNLTVVKPPVKKAGNLMVKEPVLDKKELKHDIGMDNDVAVANDNNLRSPREIVKFDVSRITNDAQINESAINNTIAYQPVTSSFADRKTDEGTQEPAVTDGDFKEKKKTPAKGFFRKVSRFIERNTGIGTVNADNELLIGVVALKLK